MLVYIAIGLLLGIGAVVQGTVGFGLGTLATPIIALVKPELLPTMIISLALVLSIAMLRREHGGISWKLVGLASLGRVPGSLFGAWAVAALSLNGISLCIGLAVILAMTLSRLGWSPRPTTPNTLVAGVASGALGTSTSIGGPPMALIMKHESPAVARGTLSATFLIGCVISLLTLQFSGGLTLLQLQAALAYLPVVAAGYLVSTRLNKKIDAARLQRLVVAVSIGAALLLLAKVALSTLGG
ncbi:sulfite exporter TauE/SafE family protein [Corynebacterium incognita]|uniref:Probable membrane transporter protein n=1 Tax=Corynebacterium incognita TaxID=2754725 RepID=A0A7G7CN94_9CORY|nr:sulfite exporter TauE/SafE family protein [Corynebacterium incognita]QNE89060.1 sulfite exporter TauE/SafE family protein [Corynebacterium incognita]